MTRAARRVGRTQSAMSRALARLRAHLGDPLMVRAGGGMVLTPRAEALGPALHGVLWELDAIVAKGPGFEPSTARRSFRVATADYVMAVVGPPLLARLAAEAPGVDLAVSSIPGELDAALQSGALDAVIAPRRPSSPGLVWTRLFTERNVCLVRSDTAPRRGLTLEAYCSLAHVVVSPEGRPSGIDEALERRGLRRRVALRVPSFLAAPWVVASSGLVATLPARLAARFAEVLPLTVLEPPLPLPEFALALGWHERVREDPSHAWFRRVVAAVARDLT